MERMEKRKNDSVKTYVCKRLKLFNYLTARGFVPFKTRPDKYNSDFNVWLFIDSDKLQETVTEYYNKTT